MRTKTLKKNKVSVVTLGCSKNLFDSEVLMGQLRANKMEVDHDQDDSDAAIVVINTCGFIDNAKQESIDTILDYAQAKKRGEVEKLFVTGCLSERYKEDLERDIPEVDAYFGTRDLPRLVKALGADYKHELVGERLITTPRHYAYFKISEGCDRPCSFCAIPLMRGKHVSTPIEDLVAEAKRLAAAGTRELLLIAQDSTYYGLDLYGKRRLADLLKALSDVEGIGWIRLHYAFPAGFPEDVLDVMASRPNIAKYLDMPLQHVSDRMLASMRRGTTKANTAALIDKIRTKIPGVALRTTLIAGYPGETKADHEEMIEWVKAVKFDRLGVFQYSHEENTHAFTLKDDVSAKEKKRRAEAVMAAQQPISLALNNAVIGKTVKVLVDRVEGKHFIGRTEKDSPEVDNEVLIPAAKDYLRVGDFAQVKITAAEEYDLVGELAGK
ncbi:MAG: 30S ribosomal protein S12 methylthiotransferase RimO [Elusimicrobiota bacterium]|nr:MAG: 30S ribosomal protein S12 methylthiotransferase RimO [Elusimicrobiota bacterium]